MRSASPSVTARFVAAFSGLLLALLLLPAHAALPAAWTQNSAAAESEFLPVRDAFRLTLSRDDQSYTAHWQIADGYYLYRNKFRFLLRDDSGAPMAAFAAPELPAGTAKDDEIFGRVDVHYGRADVRLPLKSLPAARTGTLHITWQGCADAGLCYAPETEAWPVDFTDMKVVGAVAAATTAQPAPTSPIVQPAPAGANASGIADFLAQASWAVIIGTFLLFGLGLAFTPCVLPMVPILSAIILGADQRTTPAAASQTPPHTAAHDEHHTSTRRAFMLSLAYVLGMALTYTAAGVAVGFLGAQANLSLWLQSPPVLIVFTLLFIALAMSLFGFYELQLPARLRDRLTAVAGQRHGGQLVNAAIMGVVSALVVSPCVSAPLAGALLFISSTGDAVLGGAALFALAMGMGLPLLLIGASGGKLLPKAGAWMNGVKAFFGVLLLGVAITLIERILPGWVSLALWGALLMISAIYLKALESLPAAANGWAQLRKGAGLVLLLLGAILLIGAAGGSTNPLKPLNFLHISNQAATETIAAPLFTPVRDSAELTQQLNQAQAAGKPVMIDFFAAWCVSCRIMERDLFPAPAVRAALSGYTLLRVDLTDNTDANQALMQQYAILGLPSILFMHPNGSELRAARIEGELNQGEFLHHLNMQVAPNLH